MTEHTTRSRLRRSVAAVCAAALVAGLAATPALAASAPAPTPALAAAAAPTATGHGRGSLLSVTPVVSLDRDALRAYLEEVRVPVDTVRHGVDAYRLEYRTITPEGKPTTASGLLVLPRGGPGRLAVTVHEHGTLAYRGYAPSVFDDVDRNVSLLYASAGQAAVAPDYLGLGTGPGTHPYTNARSEVTASVDMLRASRAAAHALGATLDGRVNLTGFSQGAHAAMALGRAITAGAAPGFRLRALAPVSGPYDLEHTEVAALFDGRINGASGVFYSSYYLVALNRLHGLWTDPAEVFRAPYADYIEDLFNGEHPAADFRGKLPSSVRELLTDEWYERLRRPSGALLAAIRADDGNCDWQADVPVRLFTASGDRSVPIGNSEFCRTALEARGSGQVDLVDQGSGDHWDAFLLSLPDIARWFAPQSEPSTRS